MEPLAVLFFIANLSLLLVNVYNLFPLIWSSFVTNNAERLEVPPRLKRYPKVSILVPAYREEKSLSRCTKYLRDMNYPADRLEVVIVTEVKDLATTAAAKGIAESEHQGITMKAVVVKETPEPRGKPRALNQALERATGEIIGVIDAEDVVDPELCTKVAYMIDELGFDAVQGILDMANDYDGWMNLHFRAEYGYWYNEHLASINETGYPTPLGGTTNFFKRDVLEGLGGWDPYNLTEDFDLGLRLYLGNMKVGVVKSVTREESPTTFGGWLRQRTRWQRGKLQTLKKVIRLKEIGVRKKLHTLMTCVVAHVPVLNVFSIILSITALLTSPIVSLAYSYLMYTNLVMIGVLSGLHARGFLTATRGVHLPRKWFKALVCGLTLPGYWIPQWVADLRAIIQEFIGKTIFWEKTEHRLRQLSALAIYRSSDLLSALKKSGYFVWQNRKVKGSSGLTHRIDIYGKRGSSSLMVQSIESEDEVGMEAVLGLVETARDIGAAQVLLVAVPRLAEKAKELARHLKIAVIESEKLDYNIDIRVEALSCEVVGVEH